MHLTLFLASEEATMSEEGVEKYCETKELGAGVGRVWELESVMRWREVVSSLLLFFQSGQ